MSQDFAFDVTDYHYPYHLGFEHVVIIAAEWHRDVVDVMVADAERVLREHGVGSVGVVRVPGCFELVQAASMLLTRKDQKARFACTTGVICLGCLIQGETPHFTFISDAVTSRLSDLALRSADTPLTFGVLTTLTHEQAVERVDGTYSRKGEELAVSLLKMLEVRNQLLVSDDDYDGLIQYDTDLQAGDLISLIRYMSRAGRDYDAAYLASEMGMERSEYAVLEDVMISSGILRYDSSGSGEVGSQVTLVNTLVDPDDDALREIIEQINDQQYELLRRDPLGLNAGREIDDGEGYYDTDEESGAEDEE